jgi:hypothetical protein
MAESDNYLLRAIVAKNPSLPEEIVADLSKDIYTDVRAALLQRPTLSPELVARLANDPNNNIKLAYINSTHISKADLLGALRGISHALAYPASFQSLSFETIERLFVDINQEQEWFMLVAQDSWLERFLLFHPKAPASLWRASRNDDAILQTASEMSYQREIPEEILAALSERRSIEIQLIVTKSKRCPPEILEGFAAATNTAIRVTIAAHANTPTTTLESLSQDASVAVRRSVAKNPNTNNEGLLRLSKDSDQQTRRNALRTLNDKNLLL